MSSENTEQRQKAFDALDAQVKLEFARIQQECEQSEDGVVRLSWNALALKHISEQALHTLKYAGLIEWTYEKYTFHVKLV